LLLRRRDLSPARRLELAEILAPVVARRLGMTTHKSDPVRFLALVYHLAVGGTAAAGKPHERVQS